MDNVVANIIFKSSHSDQEKLTPLKELNNDEYNTLVAELGLNINNFYAVEGRLYKYCYNHDMVRVELYDFSKQYFEGFKVKDIIEYREKYYQKLIEQKKYHDLLFLIDKPFRFKWFKELYNDIPDADKYDIFISIYKNGEYGFNEFDIDFVKDIVSHKSSNDSVELEGDIIEIYRGEGKYSTPYNKAYSWTTDINTACFFANRFSDEGTIYSAWVYKKDVIEYISRESEVLVLPEHVHDVTIYDEY